MTKLPTCWEVRKMHGVKVLFTSDYKNKKINWVVFVDDDAVYIIHNHYDEDIIWRAPKGDFKKFWEYSLMIVHSMRSDHENMADCKSINVLSTPKRHTYTRHYTRDDGTIFTAETINGKDIGTLEAEEKALYAKAKTIRALLNAHRNLKF